MDNHHDLGQAIKQRIGRYSPTSLDAATWNEVRSQVRQAVLATEPTSTEDAKSLLVTLCNYLAWRKANDLAIGDVASALDETRIALYLANRRAKASAKTVCNEQGRLRRLHRRNTGLPEPTRTAPKTSARPAPYSPAELTALRSLGNPDVDAAVDVALDTGVVVPAAHAHPNGYDTKAWKRARNAAASSGTSLNSHRLRATWAQRVSNLDVAVGDLVATGLAHTDLDVVVRAAAAPTLDQLYLAR